MGRFSYHSLCHFPFHAFYILFFPSPLPSPTAISGTKPFCTSQVWNAESTFLLLFFSPSSWIGTELVQIKLRYQTTLEDFCSTGRKKRIKFLEKLRDGSRGSIRLWRSREEGRGCGWSWGTEGYRDGGGWRSGRKVGRRDLWWDEGTGEETGSSIERVMEEAAPLPACP